MLFYVVLSYVCLSVGKASEICRIAVDARRSGEKERRKVAEGDRIAGEAIADTLLFIFFIHLVRFNPMAGTDSEGVLDLLAYVYVLTGSVEGAKETPKYFMRCVRECVGWMLCACVVQRMGGLLLACAVCLGGIFLALKGKELRSALDSGSKRGEVAEALFRGAVLVFVKCLVADRESLFVRSFYMIRAKQKIEKTLPIYAGILAAQSWYTKEIIRREVVGRRLFGSDRPGA